MSNYSKIIFILFIFAISTYAEEHINKNGVRIGVNRDAEKGTTIFSTSQYPLMSQRIHDDSSIQLIRVVKDKNQAVSYYLHLVFYGNYWKRGMCAVKDKDELYFMSQAERLTLKASGDALKLHKGAHFFYSAYYFLPKEGRSYFSKHAKDVIYFHVRGENCIVDDDRVGLPVAWDYSKFIGAFEGD